MKRALPDWCQVAEHIEVLAKAEFIAAVISDESDELVRGLYVQPCGEVVRYRQFPNDGERSGLDDDRFILDVCSGFRHAAGNPSIRSLI